MGAVAGPEVPTVGAGRRPKFESPIPAARGQIRPRHMNQKRFAGATFGIPGWVCFAIRGLGEAQEAPKVAAGRKRKISNCSLHLIKVVSVS